MPTYDYQCSSCEAQFEASQSIHDQPLQDCPHCQEPKLRRLISSAGVIFKGDGFYVNDSKKADTKQTKDKQTPKGKAEKTGESGNSSANTASNAPKNETSSAAS